MIDVEIINGEELPSFVDLLMEWRLSYFREFPYLYEGSREYEERYLSGFVSHHESILVVAREDKVCGLLSALPLLSEFEIAAEVDSLCAALNVPASEVFYIGEVVVDKECRGTGVARRLIAEAERHAVSHSYRACCLLSVVREEDHPLRPQNYRSSDDVWRKLGYVRSSVITQFEWPTIQSDGKVRNMSNDMRYWVKQLK